MDDKNEERSLDQIAILLKKNIALTEENNRMVRSLRNAGRLQAVMRLLYLVIFIGGFVWAYYFLQPYLENVKSTYSSLSSFTDFIPGKN